MDSVSWAKLGYRTRSCKKAKTNTDGHVVVIVMVVVDIDEGREVSKGSCQAVLNLQ